MTTSRRSRSAIRVLVAELFRSNAGIVGPKLVDWDEPRQLQHVGLGLDRFGEVDPVVEPGEYDQEQHDAVRDVFVLPSACLLVRADLFRALDGFDPNISFHGDDVDLCWRAHLTGARVIVAPDARVRHRERLTERRPDLHHRALQSRHRMRTVATLTGGSRLLVRSIQLVLLTLVELVVGLFTGRFGEALSSLARVGRADPAHRIDRDATARDPWPTCRARARGAQPAGPGKLPAQLVPPGQGDGDVRRRRFHRAPLARNIVRSAARLVRRGAGDRDREPIVHPQWRATRRGVPGLPGEPTRDLWSTFRSSFDGRGLGATSANPTGWGLLSLLSVLSLFRMSLLMTMSVVGLFLLGALGAWRLATVFPVNRARVAGMVVYVGTPLIPGALSRGDWSTLAWYAALPWMVHLLRRVVGLEAADPLAAVSDLTDGVAPVGPRHRARALAFLTLVVALTAAFVPVVILLWPVVGILLVLATLLAGSSWRIALWFAIATVVSTVLGYLLNMPWSLGWDYGTLVGARPAGPTGRGLYEIASLSPTTERFAVLAIALFVPLAGAVAIARAWRFTWTVRASVLVIVFGALVVASEHGALGTAVPSTPMLSVPIALGLALGAAAIVGGFGSDVLGRGFGWRQPVAVIANLAIVVGLVPAVISIGNGSWHTPRNPLPSLLATQMPEDPVAGDYRVLYVGDPRILPVPGMEYTDGIAYAITDAGPLDFTERFAATETSADAVIERALDLVATGSTLRVGRLLAPLGIRYVVIPETDDVVSTDDDPLPLADGLVASFQNQLDIGSVYGPPSLEIFVNQSWFPVGAQLSGATAGASSLAGDDALVRADLSAATPTMFGVDTGAPHARGPVAGGVLHLGIPYDERIRVDVDSTLLDPRPGFGMTTAFDLDVVGNVVVRYDEDANRGWWVASQMVLWLIVLIVAAGARSPFGRRRSATIHDETLIDFDTEPAPGIAGEALGDWADHPIEFADEFVPVGADAPEMTIVADDRPAVPPPAVRAPLIVERPRDGLDDDEPVDLAALVADVDAADGLDDGPTSSGERS